MLRRNADILVTLGVLWAALSLLIIGKAASAELDASVASIAIKVNGQSTGGGSGVLVARTKDAGYVITAQHVIRKRIGAQIVVDFPTETLLAYKAAVLAEDSEADLAMLAIARPRVSPRPISWEPVKEGQQVWQSGFGHSQVGPRQVKGSVKSVNPFDGCKSFGFLPLARSGDSGGPVITEEGKVVGVITETFDSKAPGANQTPARLRTAFAASLADNQWLRKHLPETSVVVKKDKKHGSVTSTRCR